MLKDILETILEIGYEIVDTFWELDQEVIWK